MYPRTTPVALIDILSENDTSDEDDEEEDGEKWHLVTKADDERPKPLPLFTVSRGARFSVSGNPKPG
ncbi:unnamed protein product, partial [Didymodactylos carnosus]